MKKIILAALFLCLVTGVYGVGYSEDGSGFATFGGTRMCMSDGSVPLTGTWDFSNATVNLSTSNFNNLSVDNKLNIGNITYLSSGNSSDIQTALNYMTDGGTLVLGSGDWLVYDSPILIPDNVKLQGQGYSTRLYLNGDDISLISVLDKSNVIIENLFLDGNGQTLGQHGIRVSAENSNITNITIKNIYLKDIPAHGVHFLGDGNFTNRYVNIDGINCVGVSGERGCVTLFHVWDTNVNNVNVDGSGKTKYPFQVAQGCRVNVNNVNAFDMNSTLSYSFVGKGSDPFEICSVNINNYNVDGIRTGLRIDENANHVNLNNFVLKNLENQGITAYSPIHISNGYIINTSSHGVYLENHNGTIISNVLFQDIGAYAVREENSGVNETIVSLNRFINITQSTAVYNRNGVDVGSVVCNNIGTYTPRNCD